MFIYLFIFWDKYKQSKQQIQHNNKSNMLLSKLLIKN